jgi:hypothetical protein
MTASLTLRASRTTLLSAMAAVLLAASLASTAAAEEPPWLDPEPVPPGSAAGLTAIGGGLIAGGFVLAGAADGAGIARHRGHPVRVALMANLLATGIPSAVTGTIQLAHGSRGVANPANVETWRRATAGKALHMPYVITGIAMNVAWLSIVLHFPGEDFIWQEGTYLLPIAGLATLSTGLALAAAGDSAAARLYGRDGEWDDKPGRLLLKSGIAMLATGGAGLVIGGLLCMPFELSFSGDGSFSARIMLTGMPFVLAGIPMTIAGALRCKRADRDQPLVESRTQRRRPVLVGIGPMGGDRTHGLTASWVF